MNTLAKSSIDERLPSIKESLEINKKTGRQDLIQRNVLNGYELAGFVVISLLREGEKKLKPHVLRVQEWRKYLLAVNPFEFESVWRFAEMIGIMGYLLDQKPDEKELEFINQRKDTLDIVSAISWNLYTGKAPDENLPGPEKGIKKHEKLISKYVELLLALLHNGADALREFDKHYAQREKNDAWTTWFGGGARNPFYLDPLALCILKYRKPDFESDSIHMKGYKTLVAAGF